MKKAVLILIDLYRKIISPNLKHVCRFYPSCSNYAYDAIIKYGLLKGSIMSIKRILKCHPFNPGGYDPVQ